MSLRTSRLGAITFGVAALVGTMAAASATLHTWAAAPAPAPSRPAPRAPLSPQPTAPMADVRAERPLSGKVIGIDPGHNGGNAANPGIINALIWNGRAQETCDTTGTSTDGGYTEAQFNFSVAQYLRADLIRDGARVVLTRTSNTGVGPCVDRRAEIIDKAHADVAVDIHADGGPANGRGFTVIEPLPAGRNDAVIGASDRFGSLLRAAMLSGTPMPESNYYGADGTIARDDLAGLNLTTVPKVLIECGNMRNWTDASLLTSARFQQAVARAMEQAILRFLPAALGVPAALGAEGGAVTGDDHGRERQ